MDDIEADRVYAGGTDDADLFVAAETGLVRVAVAGDRVGRFGVVVDEPIRDVAAGTDRLVVATESTTLFGTDVEDLAPSGIGSSTAVALEEDRWVAADEDGRLVAVSDGEASHLGTPGSVRAIDPPLVATADGVVRIGDTAVIGLADVADVTARPVPRAAADSGVHRLADGWQREATGRATTVAGGRAGRAAAVIKRTLYRRTKNDWQAVDLPTESMVADVAFGAGTYAVTKDGIVLVDAGDGWRRRRLGVTGVKRVAVRPTEP